MDQFLEQCSLSHDESGWSWFEQYVCMFLFFQQIK